MTAGRPTEYTPEVGDEICSRLAQGRSLLGICRDDDMPSTVTVYAWLRKHEEFLNNYARAREDQADTLADSLTDLADAATPETVNVVRLQVDTRKWAASKLKPKKYSDKVLNEHSGPDGGPVRLERIERVIVDPANKDPASVS